MDYDAIDTIISAKSLASDPAFEDLIISIEPIPSFNSCPLGLYYPDTRTILLPPDASEGALLHELGHRHGDYHYGDLSEKYAEDFRKRYRGGKVLLYKGNDFNRLPSFSGLFEEGEKGAVEIALLQPLTQDILDDIRNQLYSYGEIPEIHYGNSEVPVLRVEFTKGIDWLVIIGGTLAGFTAVTAGIIGYAIYKVSVDNPWITPIAIAGTASSFLLALWLGAKYATQVKSAFGRVAA